MEEVVDISDPQTWGAEVFDLVRGLLDGLNSSEWREYPRDHLGDDRFRPHEESLRGLLGDHRLLSYHATRLLPHEIVEIQAISGLETLSDDLRARKVASAQEHFPEAFDEADPAGAELLKAGPNNWQGTARARLGSIDFVAPYVAFDRKPRGFMNLLDTWGGETLGWLSGGAGASRLSDSLSALSTPAVVEFAPRISTLNTYRGLLPAFVGSLGKASGDWWGQWRTSETVGPPFVFEVITPESDRWPAGLSEYQTS